jgi:Flp pilus assembly protein TadD
VKGVKIVSKNRQRVPLGIYVFATVLLLRLFVLLRLTGSPFLFPAHGDMHFYNDWALRIVRGQWTDHLAFYGLPLYAYILAGIYKIFGYNPFLPAFFQAVVDSGTAVLIYGVADRIFRDPESLTPLRFDSGKVVGCAAGLGWGLCQPAQAYSVILMPTCWSIFVFWLLVWQIIERENVPTFGLALLFGLLIGFTAMGVATILFVIPLFLAAIFVRWKDAGKWLCSKVSIALVVGVVVGASPAFLHNYIIARDPVFLSAHGGVNLWIGNNPWANGYPRFPAGLHAGQEAMLQDSIHGAEAAVGHSLKRSEVSAYWSAKAKDYIAHNFVDWLKLTGLKVANFWNAFRYDDLSVITTLREERVTIPGIAYGLIAALAIPGMILAWRRFPLSHWIVAALFLHMVSLLSVFVTERYRLAAVPGLLLFAAFGVNELWKQCIAARIRRAIAYACLVALSTLFVSNPKRDPSLWALDNYNTGLQALDLNHLQDAEWKLGLAYSYVPDNAELNFALGNLRLAQGHRDVAKSFYFTTLQLDSKHEGSYNNLGVLALEENRGQLAATFFSKALEQNPKDPKTYYLLARAHLKIGDSQSARAEIRRAVSLDPTQPEFQDLKENLERKSELR